MVPTTAPTAAPLPASSLATPADDRPGGRAASCTPDAFTLRAGRRGLAAGGLRERRRIDAGLLLGPDVALALVLVLLIGALTLGWIDQRLLSQRSRSRNQRHDRKHSQCSFAHYVPPVPRDRDR
jgi:hypothetical protein